MEWLCGDRPASRLLSSGSVSCDYFFARVSLVCFFVIRTLVRMLALSAAPVRIEASTACPQLAVGATLHPSHREPSQKSSRASGARRSWPGSLAVGRVHGTQKRARASASRSRGRVECPLGPRAPYRGRSPRVPENPKTHHRWLACALVCTPTAVRRHRSVHISLPRTSSPAPTQKLDGLVVGGQTRSPSLHVREIIGLRRTTEAHAPSVDGR